MTLRNEIQESKGLQNITFTECTGHLDISKQADAIVLKGLRQLFSSNIFPQRQFICGLITFIVEKDEIKAYKLFKRAFETPHQYYFVVFCFYMSDILHLHFLSDSLPCKLTEFQNIPVKQENHIYKDIHRCGGSKGDV